MNTKQRLGEELQKRFERSGLRQDDVAERAGVSQPTVSRVLAGERGTVEMINAIARVFGRKLGFVKLGEDE